MSLTCSLYRIGFALIIIPRREMAKLKILTQSMFVVISYVAAVAPPAAYPPMHWHSWNTFCKENAVNEQNMRQMADSLISTGMAAAGYDMVNVVCNGWTGRDPTTHELTENRSNWPNGIRALAEYLHAKSPPLKLGCYTSPATKNCCGEPGSLGYEDIDMETFAKMGCDHVMVDWCRSYVSPAETKAEYDKIGKAIANSSNPDMVYGIWAGGMGKSWKWAEGVGGDYWRVSRDIKMYKTPEQTFDQGVLFNFDTAYSVPDIDRYTGPGHFTFLDQMLIGVETKGSFCTNGAPLTLNATVAHMSMWVMAASPLLTANDVRNMSAEIKEVLTNSEVLAVHKDPLVQMAKRLDVGGAVNAGHYQCTLAFNVYGRPLSDGSMAVMVLNRGNDAGATTIHMEDVGDSMHLHYKVRDLWAHADLPPASINMRVTVPGRGVRLFRMTPIAPPPPPPTPAPLRCPTGTHTSTTTTNATTTATKVTWKQQTPGGYWHNLSPDDKPNGASLDLCAAKCASNAKCMAFEVYDAGQSATQACYTFEDMLAQPFTLNSHSTTCVAVRVVGDGDE